MLVRGGVEPVATVGSWCLIGADSATTVRRPPGRESLEQMGTRSEDGTGARRSDRAWTMLTRSETHGFTKEFRFASRQGG